MAAPSPTSESSGTSRRTLLKATTATAGAIAAAAALGELAPSAEAATGFVKGVDVSWAPQMEAHGYSWKNASGQTQDLLSNDVLPTWVQIGNEINSGICHPVGSVSSPAQMTGLLTAAYDRVKAVSPSAVVCIHLAQPQKYDSMTTFFSRYAAAGRPGCDQSPCLALVAVPLSSPALGA